MMRKGRLLSVVLSSLIALSALIPGVGHAAANESPVQVTLRVDSDRVLLNGEDIQLDARGSAPLLIDGSVYLPASSVMKLFGGTSKWDARTKTVSLSYKNNKAELRLNQRQAKVNGKSVTLSAAPKAVNGTTVIPLRFLENFNISITWHGANLAITLIEADEGSLPWYAEGQNIGKLNSKESLYYDGGRTFFAYQVPFLKSWGTPIVLPNTEEVGNGELADQVSVNYSTVFYFSEYASIIGIVWENYNQLGSEEFMDLLGMTNEATLSDLEEISIDGADRAFVIRENFNDSLKSSDSTTVMAFAGNKVYSINFTQDIYDAYQRLDDDAYIYFIDEMIPNLILGQNAGAAG